MKLNLGSGINDIYALLATNPTNGDWKNIDICAKYNPNECYDISTGIREKDNSIDEIWMGDFFEHLLRLKAKFVMQECFRVLEKGGKLRISVPDMEVVMPIWLNGNEEEKFQMGRLIWGEQDEKNQHNCIPDSHFYGYTESSLKQLILSCGFEQVNRISIHGLWFELAFEAFK